ncbi:hypothetical protein DYB26_006239 [Aphanomyces astaci]|uniref:Dynein assembly factor 1, axonemal homolog n=1 Tax=Aphanomyces astaci TaxID=112090 RepID=A0A418F3W5_APHAT|nr:hypothetical protein DYB26_006239 [Aphanomyces astaci]
MFSTNNEEIDFLERLRKRDREKLKLKQKGHLPVMDRETLVQLCVDNDGYETPDLNDNLFAHFKGFQKIEGLEPFFNLKALWLESNGLSVIENVDCLVHLRCLYLNKNRIERMENLHNAIHTIEGLGALTQLTSFNISKNELEHVADIEALKNYKSITNLDLSHNKLRDPSILHVFEAMTNLKALRLTGNDAVSKTKYFRKTYITTLPQLGYLDRPIFAMERHTAAAWKEGGAAAEEVARQAFIQHEHDERRRSLQEFRDWQADIREKKLAELAAPKEAGGGDDDSEKATQQSRRMEQARADSAADKALVAGNGIVALGAAFWAEEDAKQRQKQQVNGATVEAKDGAAAVLSETEHQVTDANPPEEQVVDALKSRPVYETDYMLDVQDIALDWATISDDEKVVMVEEEGFTSDMVATEAPYRPSTLQDMAPHSLFATSAASLPPPPPPSTVERDTWESLQRKTGTAAFASLLPPQHLPSAYVH